MNKHQQTAYGLETLIRQLCGLPAATEEYSTVNERLNILSGAQPTANEKITLGVLIAGNKGHGLVPGVGGIALLSTEDHLANHGSLYGQLPFAIRDIDSDLTLAQQQRFCLRKVEQVNGVNKFVYYGYRLQMSADNVVINKWKITRNAEGAETWEPFVPSNEDLYPTPPTLPDLGAITASNVSIKVEAIITVVLSEVDINEFVEAVKILYNGDERYAVMSEFALCTNANRIVEVQGSAGFINFNESIATQIYAFTMEHKALYYNTQRLEIKFNVGNQIPLFATESIPTMEVIP